MVSHYKTRLKRRQMDADSDGRWWYWVWGRLVPPQRGSNHAIIGPFPSELEAIRVGWDKFSHYEVVRLNTRSEQRAARFMKAKLLEGMAAVEALKNVRHRGSDIGV